MTRCFKNKDKGQSLVELLVAMGISVVILGAAVGLLSTSFTINVRSTDNQNAAFIGRELMDNVVALAEGDWYAIYNLDKASVFRNICRRLSPTPPFECTDWEGSEKPTIYPYYIDADGVPAAGTEDVVRGGKTFTRYFTVENVSRERIQGGSGSYYTSNPLQRLIGFLVQSASAYGLDPPNGQIESPYNADDDDPATQKITVYVSWDVTSGGVNRKTISFVQYVTSHDISMIGEMGWSLGGPDGSVQGDSGHLWQFSSVCNSAGPVTLALSDGCSGWPYVESGTLTSEEIDTGVSDGAGFLYLVWYGDLPDGTYVNFEVSQTGQENDFHSIQSSSPWVPVGIGINFSSPVVYVRITLGTYDIYGSSPSVYGFDLHFARGTAPVAPLD